MEPVLYFNEEEKELLELFYKGDAYVKTTCEYKEGCEEYLFVYNSKWNLYESYWNIVHEVDGDRLLIGMVLNGEIIRGSIQKLVKELKTKLYEKKVPLTEPFEDTCYYLADDNIIRRTDNGELTGGLIFKNGNVMRWLIRLIEWHGDAYVKYREIIDEEWNSIDIDIDDIDI